MNMFPLKNIGILNTTSFTCFGLWGDLLSSNFKNNSEALCLLLWKYFLFRKLQLLYGINRHKLSLKSLVLSVRNTFLTLPFKYCLLHYGDLKNLCCIVSLHVYLMFYSTTPTATPLTFSTIYLLFYLPPTTSVSKEHHPLSNHSLTLCHFPSDADILPQSLNHQVSWILSPNISWSINFFPNIPSATEPSLFLNPLHFVSFV